MSSASVPECMVRSSPGRARSRRSCGARSRGGPPTPPVWCGDSTTPGTSAPVSTWPWRVAYRSEPGCRRRRPWSVPSPWDWTSSTGSGWQPMTGDAQNWWTSRWPPRTPSSAHPLAAWTKRHHCVPRREGRCCWTAWTPPPVRCRSIWQLPGCSCSSSTPGPSTPSTMASTLPDVPPVSRRRHCWGSTPCGRSTTSARPSP